MLKKEIVALATWILIGVSSLWADRKPNIIYFNVDDLGVMDVGFNSSRYNTPNIDKLRSEGMRLRSRCELRPKSSLRDEWTVWSAAWGLYSQ